MKSFTSATAARNLCAAILFLLGWTLPAAADDLVPPVLTGCPDEPVLNVHCIDEVPPPADVTATDNVDGILFPIFSETQSNPNSSCQNVIIRSWRVTDTAGNSASCAQIITVDDNIPPVLIGCPDEPVLKVHCLEEVPPPPTVTALDNCGSLTPIFSEMQTDPNSACHNVITRVWRVTDFCGNSTSCAQIITVDDNIPPVLIGCPDEPVLNVHCLAEVPPPPDVTALDNCGPLAPIFSEMQTDPNSSCGNVITRVWRVTDFCGNSTSCAQIITVKDDIAPVLSGCPPPILTVTELPPPAAVTASDNCDRTVTPVFSEIQSNPGACNNVITRVWRATDHCGNSTSCSQIITLVDTTPPVLSGCPPPELEVANPSLVPAPAPVTATDNCDGSLPPVFSEHQTDPGSECDNIITRSWVATDAAGNSASCAQVITVKDSQPPAISGVAVDPSELWPPNHTFRDVLIDYLATDNCPGATCVLSVTSSEPALGHGSGHTEPDWIIVDEHRVQLRSEREGSGDGRIYTITITCSDAEGNITTTTVQVLARQHAAAPRPVPPPKGTGKP